MQYQKRPVVIDAIRWTGDNFNIIRQFVGTARPIHQLGDKLGIDTLEGVMTASVGDFIIKGVKGEFYPCNPDIFAATYEDASTENPQIAALTKERDEARAEVARLKTKLIVEDDRLGYINAHSERRIAALEKVALAIIDWDKAGTEPTWHHMTRMEIVKLAMAALAGGEDAK